MGVWSTRAWLWGPVIGLMAVIFMASATPNLTTLPRGLPDWFAHGVGYALLSGLALRACAGGRLSGVGPGSVLEAIALATVYGLTDEVHQMFVPGRSAEVADLLADAVGATVAALAGGTWSLAAGLERR